MKKEDCGKRYEEKSQRGFDVWELIAIAAFISYIFLIATIAD